MYSFFVLGIIPGTNIEISFVAWLIMTPVLLAAAIIIRPYLQLHRFVALGKQSLRQPLPASQLHHRLSLR
ncbi:MAG TPA: hypothetical protein VK712_02675 [Verrucomicrobiae bacterium]|jgi:hypothetical protein|nr:hypothetical protein [Verrucomicrobiae bacterium]